VTTRAPKTRTAPVPADDGILRLTTSSSTPVDEAREPLFYIDGEEFTVPKLISPRIVYLGIDKMRREGPLFGSMYIAELVLGKDQYRRLLEHYEAEAITQEQFDQVVKLVGNLFFDMDRRAGGSVDGGGKASDDSPAS
jgi:hypothetical protein